MPNRMFDEDTHVSREGSRMLDGGTYVCQLDEATQRKAAEELNENPRERASHIEALRKWVKAQPHLTCRTDDHFLLRFLRFGKFSQLRAQEKLDNFLTVRCSPTQGVPDWFNDLNPFCTELARVLELGICLPLPGIDDQGRKVILVRTGAYDPKEVCLNDLMRFEFLTSDCLQMDEMIQVHGLSIVLDFREFTMTHLATFSRDMIAKCMKCWQDVYPTRSKSVNYFKTSVIFNTFYELCKYFMTDKTRKRLHFHRDSLQSLHTEVPKRLLPTEYGGEAGPLMDIARNWHETIKKAKPEFELNARYFRVDESKRPGKPEEQWGLPGTFRKLAT